MTQHSLLSAAALTLLAGVFCVPQTARAQEKNILLVGNSLVRGVKRPLVKIFKERGLDVKVKAAAPGIRDLQWHAASQRTKKIIDGKPNKPAWDIIFLQQKSIGLFDFPPPDDPTEDDGYQAVRDLYQIIQTNSPGTATALFMTWRERTINPTSALWDQLRDWEFLNPETNVLQTFGYVPIAQELGIPVAPAGWGIRAARMQLSSPPAYDLPSTDDLWKGSKGRHLSTAGQYEAACVLYAVITGESPIGVWGPDRYDDPSFVTALQTVADQTVFSDPSAWNLPASGGILGNN